MRLHVYSSGAAAPVTHPDVPDGTRLRKVIEVDIDEQVFKVGEETEVDLELIVVEVFGAGPGHVVKHRCPQVQVTATYVGEVRTVPAHPAMHVKTVRERAATAFGLHGQTADDLVLRLPGSTEELPDRHPIGSYETPGTCSVAVDLLHAHRSQG